jgi:hypothetical protein
MKWSATAAIGLGASDNAWRHIAVTRTAGAWYLFIDGESQAVTYSVGDGSVTAPTISEDLKIIAEELVSTFWIDEYRVVVGEAVWSANFEVPTASYYNQPSNNPYINQMVLMLHGEGMYDSSPYNHSVTDSGGATISNDYSKYGGGSIYLPEAGAARVIIDDHAAFDLGQNDFTIDCWVRPEVSEGIAPTGGLFYHGDASDIFTSVAYLRDAGASGFEYYIEIVSRTAIDFQLRMRAYCYLPLQEWTHIAVVREGSGNWYIFKNGVSHPISLTVGSFEYIIPQYGGNPRITFAQGYIDEYRILINKAAWTEDFNPPKRAYGGSKRSGYHYKKPQE